MIGYIALILFAILPSLVWMFYYLQKDLNPEPKRFIFYVFIAGILSAIPAFFIQTGGLKLISPLMTFSENIALLAIIMLVVQQVFVIALSEEFFKYFSVFVVMMRHPELDEPIDMVIYMIVAALGFAAIENFFTLISLGPELIIEEMALMALLRFSSATFLHALASGILGVFLVYAYRRRSKLFLTLGFLVASAIHGAYNMLIIRAEGNIQVFASIVLLLLVTAIILSIAMKKTDKIKSICFIK